MAETLPVYITCCLSLMLHDSSAQTQAYDVIIMGAGASGIAAAKTFYEANITNILIIEANWYVGGRTAVHSFSDYKLNIGASWIEGACVDPSLNCSEYKETNPMLTAAYKYNISFVNSDWENTVILDIGGNEHNQTNSDNRFDKFYEAQECVENMMANVTANINPEQISYFAALYLCGWPKPLQTIDATIQWYAYDFNAQHAKWSRPHNPEYERTFSTYGPNGVFITDERGYNGIITALANEFMDINDGDKLKLNSPITKVQYSKENITVTLDTNEEYSAQYGIVTFPLGVLQSNTVEFVPQLPLWKIKALLAFDFIDSTPIYVKWPYNFWNGTAANNSEFILLNDDRFGYFTWVYNLDHPNLLNGSLLWRFDATLDLAQTVAVESLNDTIKQIVELKLSHYFDSVPYPTDIFVASWHSNPYIQGSYSNWPIGFTDDSKEAMVWPLLPRLFFAGEAMSDFDYGYVHSAWLSGEDTANQILACMGYGDANGYECPKDYIPPTQYSDCQSLDESVFKELVWLWIVLGVLCGIISHYLFAKYCHKNEKHKSDKNYGAVEDVAMVTPQN